MSPHPDTVNHTSDNMQSRTHRPTLHKSVMNCAVIGLLLISACCLTGCSRRFWREQAERDTYEAVTDKLNSPLWAVPRIDLTPDPRSRFYDPWDPDSEPLPPDDPAAHETMHCVSGRKGYKNWHKLGTALSIENPQWLAPYGIETGGTDPVVSHSMVTLDDITLPDAIELTYIQNPDYQTSIEDLYLNALVVTQEQFLLGVRYAGPGVRPPGFTALATERASGADTFGLGPHLGITQLLPTGGQIAVELANNTLWLLGGGTANSATTLAYSLTQPLLFSAGRKVVLEALTQSERNVLYSARDLARFRKELFTGVASDFLRILQQVQIIRNLESNIVRVKQQLEIQRAIDARPRAEVSSDLPSFPDGIEIPESIRDRFSYDRLTRTLRWNGPMPDDARREILGLSDDPDYQAAAAQLIRFRDSGTTTLSTAQLLTRLNRSDIQLLTAERQLADLTDDFKTRMGLPPNIQLTLDQSLLERFSLIDPSLTNLEQDFLNLAEELGPALIPEDEDSALDSSALLADIRTFNRELIELRSEVKEMITEVNSEFDPVRDLLESKDLQDPADGTKRRFANEEERQRVAIDVADDENRMELNQEDFEKSSRILDFLVKATSEDDFPQSLDTNQNQRIDPDELPENWRKLRRDNGLDDQPQSYVELIIEAGKASMSLRENLQIIVQSLQVIQADLRVETIAINPFVLPGGDTAPDIEEVVRVGLEYRLDLMNARAEVMDARRRVEVAANALEATLDVTFAGQVGTAPGSKKPFDFSSDAAQINAGLAFDTPADKIAERNIYNAALIAYQRARRAYIAQEDAVKQQIRRSWRQLKVSEQQLEIDRQAVRTATRQYDIAAFESTGPGQNNALSLLNALDAVPAAQNSLVGDWVTYETNRLNIFFDMGIMEIDSSGLWQDTFYTRIPTSEIIDPTTEEVIPAPGSESDSPLTTPPTPLDQSALEVEDNAP